MTDARKKDARPSVASAAQGSTARLSPERLRSAALAVGFFCLVLAAGWRWHEAVASAPIRVDAGEGPTAILVLQEGDCPDRTAALATWLGTLTAPGRDIPVSVAWVGPSPLIPPPWLAGLPELDHAAATQAARALLRLGSEGTPALLLVDGSGHPLLGDTFTEQGPGARVEAAAGMLRALRLDTSLSPPAESNHPRPLEEDPWNR